jgi:periplasmic protein TonB
MNTLPLPMPGRAEALPRPLKLAIGASVGLHVLALLWQHGAIPASHEAILQPLQVVLHTTAPLPVPNPPPVAVEAQPVQPPKPVHRVAVAPPKPAPILTRPVNPGTPAPAIARSAPAPVAAAVPIAKAATPPVDNVPVAPVAPAPVAAIVRAEPAPAAPAHADEPLDPALLERYGRSLSSALARQQQYPRIAAMRGWEGEVQLRVTIARKGNIVATQVVHSSGFEVLDQNAVQLVTNAGPLPRPPETLQNREIQIIVPVHYKLEKPT